VASCLWNSSQMKSPNTFLLKAFKWGRLGWSGGKAIPPSVYRHTKLRNLFADSKSSITLQSFFPVPGNRNSTVGLRPFRVRIPKDSLLRLFIFLLDPGAIVLFSKFNQNVGAPIGCSFLQRVAVTSQLRQCIHTLSKDNKLTAKMQLLISLLVNTKAREKRGTSQFGEDSFARDPSKGAIADKIEVSELSQTLKKRLSATPPVVCNRVRRVCTRIVVVLRLSVNLGNNQSWAGIRERTRVSSRIMVSTVGTRLAMV
jgi:hypothetical protein